MIVEQSGQRGLVDTPAKALVVYLNKYPDDDWAQQQVDIIASCRDVR